MMVLCFYMSVIDRMHLDEDQRSHFINIGNQCNIPVHGLVMMASKEDVSQNADMW